MIQSNNIPFNNKLCILATFARSSDNFHEKNNLIHLVSSIFSVKWLDINWARLENLRDLNTNKIEWVFIVDNLSPQNTSISSPSLYKCDSSFMRYFRIPFYLFYPRFEILEDGTVTEINKFISKIPNLLDRDLFEGNNSKGLEFILNRSLFVFVDLSWEDIQVLLKIVNVKLSGGSNNKRQYLSTVDFSLSQIVQALGFTSTEIYSSYNTQKVLYKIPSDENKLLHQEFMISVIKRWINKNLDSMWNLKNQKEKEIVEKQRNIQDLIVEKVKITSSKKLQRIDAHITSLNDVINKCKIDNSNLDSEILALDNQIKGLNNQTYEEIYCLYYNNYHNKYISEESLKIKNLLRNRNVELKHNSTSNFLGKRSYSTLSRAGMSSLNKFSFPYLLTHKQKDTTIMNKRYMSLYNKNSIVSENLMKLIYSKDSKENIQINIEKYLILEQNNLLSKNNSTNKTSVVSNINYNLMDSNLTNILIESKINIKKLYSHYINNKLINMSENDKFAFKILSEIEFEYLINLMFGKLLLILSNKNLHNKFTIQTEVFYSLGKDLINRYNYYLYFKNKSNYSSFSNFILLNPNLIITCDDATKIVSIGKPLMSWLIELKLLSTKTIIDKKEKRNIFIAGENLNTIVSKTNLNVLSVPVKIPMVCLPKRHSNIINPKTGKPFKIGGFLLNDEYYVEPLIIKNSFLADKPEISNDSLIYKMADNISSVAFAINQEVLDFIYLYHKKFDLIIDPDSKHPFEDKDKLSTKERKEFDSFKSIKNLEANVLNLAEMFRNSPEIFIPIRLDYRGRLYCNVEYLHYQGSELAKSLLKFAKGEIVYLNDKLSIDYLKIYGANCYGNNIEKKSFLDRIKWVNENINNIIDYENGILISTAENKLLFIAFCIEFKKLSEAYSNNKSYFITHLPVQLDASCNGFQHLSFLLEYCNLAKQVNLTKTAWSDVPEDFYTFISLRIKEFLSNELRDNRTLDLDQIESYKKITEIGFHNHRSLVKKTIMTIPYNATAWANVEDMLADFDYVKKGNERVYIYKKNESIQLKLKDFNTIVGSLYHCLYNDFPRLKNLLNYLKKIAIISNKLGISIPWSLPSGLTVKQKYYGSKTIKFKPYIYSKALLNINVLDKNSLNTRKQIRSFMPNLVHSLDAASLALLIDNFFKESKNLNFYSIHDCFAVTCNNISLIYELLKLSYYNIYSKQNFLKNFDEKFKDTIVTLLGKDAFDQENGTIYLNIYDGSVIKLDYPDINDVIKPTSSAFVKGYMNSSYLIK